jgi:hypothetical protein
MNHLFMGEECEGDSERRDIGVIGYVKWGYDPETGDNRLVSV